MASSQKYEVKNYIIFFNFKNNFQNTESRHSEKMIIERAMKDAAKFCKICYREGVLHS